MSDNNPSSKAKEGLTSTASSETAEDSKKVYKYTNLQGVSFIRIKQQSR